MKQKTLVILLALSMMVTALSWGGPDPDSYIRQIYWLSILLAPKSIVWIFLIGLSIGVMVCPTCGFPLAFYAASKERDERGALKASMIFNISRITTTILFAATVSLLGAGMVSMQSRIISFGFAGILMLYLALDLFGIIQIRSQIATALKTRLTKNMISKELERPFEYMIWGGLLGVVCSSEFILPLLAVTAISVMVNGYLWSIAATVTFGLGTSIPITILVLTGARGITSLQVRTRLNLRKYLGYSGGAYMGIMGTQYVFAAIATIQSASAAPIIELIGLAFSCICLILGAMLIGMQIKSKIEGFIGSPTR